MTKAFILAYFPETNFEFNLTSQVGRYAERFMLDVSQRCEYDSTSRTTRFQFLPFSLREVSKYGVISSPYFPVFNPNIGKYGPQITPYLETFHAVSWMIISTQKYTKVYYVV